MIPKEKAKELIDRFKIGNDHTIAKQCALICVNEISEDYSGDILEYWQEVKQEIEKL